MNQQQAKPKLRRSDVVGRFWAQVDKDNGPTLVPSLGRCWVWTGYRDNKGRGQYRGIRGCNYAPQASFFLEHGRQARPQCLHHCDGGDIGCVRPSHLYEGTHADNMADKAARGRVKVHLGERHHAAKLTNAQVVAIRGALELGSQNSGLAVCFGVSSSLISVIGKRRGWVHLC